MNIVEVVQNYGIALERRGKLYVGFCPFHDDKRTPNFTVYPFTNSWYCYAEQKGGDVIQFIALIEGIDRSEVKKRYLTETIKSKLSQLKTPPKLDFKEETNLLMSNVVREFLQQNRPLLSTVLSVLQKFDAKINSSSQLTYEDGVLMVEKMHRWLYNISDARKKNHDQTTTT